MAATIVNVLKKWSGRDLESSPQRRAVSDGYTVLLSEADDAGLQIAKESSEIPQAGEPWPFDAWMVAKQHRVRVLSQVLYEVEVVYESVAGGSFGENPIAAKPKISMRAVKNRNIVDTDLDGKPIVNSAGVPFEPLDGLTIDILLVVQRNLGNVNVPWLLDHVDCVNSDFFLVPPGQALIDDIAAVQVSEEAFTYWDVTFQVLFRKALPVKQTLVGEIGGPAKAWYRRLLDAGTHERVSQNPLQWRAITDNHGSPISRPVALNGFGLKLAENDDPVWLEFRFHDAKPFGPLRILT